ncbi:MAG TPA: lipid II flippase MurJ, partial [Acidimicrobiales bacterium]|nr:lipid II flippase MurJ [Acidimicrobiales bacterium]
MRISVTGDGPGLLRSTATITAWNTVSRITGFVRVLAVGAALGATFLGNTYQSSNLVSNLLFDVLAAGLLSAPLVPVLVPLLDRGRQEEAERVAGTVLSVSLVGLGVVVVVAVSARTAIMRLLTLDVHDAAVRSAEVRLGVFLLWFFLPQVLLYAVGAVMTALMHAARRFAAAAAAPVANNVAVTITMVAFLVMRHGTAPGLVPGRGQRLVLAVGTTAGVAAMATVPLVAAWRAGLRPRLCWELRRRELRQAARLGGWGAALLGAGQALIGVTLILANRVSGGVVAYQIAFTFFLLPHAVLAHPMLTALYPRLAALAAVRRWPSFASELGRGLRGIVLVTLPASAAIFVLGGPMLRLLRIGALDPAGARLVGRVLAAYAIGLAGYGAFLLLARASTAAGDARLPAVIAAAMAGAGALAMAAASGAARGGDRVVVLGVVHSAVVTTGAWLLLSGLRRRIGDAVPVAATIGRGLVVATATGAMAAAGARVAPAGGG